MILCIDTAIDRCGVGLCKEGQMIGVIEDETAFKASEVLHTQIQRLLSAYKCPVKELSAIAVNGGPGSYTGLRIGASAAKGLCYALDIPLIHIDGFQLMKEGVVSRLKMDDFEYYVPMIDARRNEVFTTVLNKTNEVLLMPQAMVLEPRSFSEYSKHETLFFGNGAKKASDLLDSSVYYRFIEFSTFITDFSALAWNKWNDGIFEDFATYVPNYLKKFHFTGKPTVKRNSQRS